MTGTPRDPADDAGRLDPGPHDLLDWVTEGFDTDPTDPGAGPVGAA